METYTTRQIVSRLRRHQPVNESQILNLCELPLKLCGTGASRRAYFVPGSEVVVKVLLFEKKDLRERCHSWMEYNAAWTVLTQQEKFKEVLPHTPDVYCCLLSGVLAMRRYEGLTGKDRFEAKKFEKKMSCVLAEVCNLGYNPVLDLHWGNLGRDKNGTIIMLDMGEFGDACSL